MKMGIVVVLSSLLIQMTHNEDQTEVREASLYHLGQQREEK